MRPPKTPRLQTTGHPGLHGSAGVAANPRGTRIELRKGRRITLAGEDGRPIFLVERGCVTLDAALSDGRRQILLLLYPDDIISQTAAPPLKEIGLTAATAGTLMRVRLDTPESLCAACGLLPEALPARLARLGARIGLHALAVGRLTGEERLATLLVEMASHLGAAGPGGISVPLPLSRSDMADYLALNPDTLSRLFSRLKARDLIATPTRSLVTIRDLPTVRKMTPLGDALEQMQKGAAMSGTASLVRAGPHPLFRQ